MLAATTSFSIRNPTPEPKLSIPTIYLSSDRPSEPQPRKQKGSAKLNLWSRARSIRSGRKLNRPVENPVQAAVPVEKDRTGDAVSDSEREDDGETRDGKSIYMVSDGTGWTAENSVNAALGQFDHCLVDHGCSVSTHLFSGVSFLSFFSDIKTISAGQPQIMLETWN